CRSQSISFPLSASRDSVLMALTFSHSQSKFCLPSGGCFHLCVPVPALAPEIQRIHGVSFASRGGHGHNPFQPDKFIHPLLLSCECRRHVTRASADVPDYLPATWADSRQKRAIGPRLDFTAEETVQCQLQALKCNNEPHQDHGVEVMYRFAGFDPFERSNYFGTAFDLGQFERFRRIFHHSTYRVLLSHKEIKILSSLYVNENCFKQRVWTRGSRPDEEEIFEFTMVQRVGGYFDGYWLTESL
ncbi:hypothetical protein KI387_007979, partial [Taxus chinensis]